MRGYARPADLLKENRPASPFGCHRDNRLGSRDRSGRKLARGCLSILPATAPADAIGTARSNSVDRRIWWGTTLMHNSPLATGQRSGEVQMRFPEQLSKQLGQVQERRRQ